MTGSVTREASWVSVVLSAYRAGRPLALLFDYDGTLTPIVRHPSLARLPAANRDRLARLAALPGVAVGVISGRALGDVCELVGLPGLFYAGSGGLEVDLRGRRVEYPDAPAFRRVLAGLERTLAPVVARYPGTWVERKPVALSLHYRGLAPAVAVRFRAETAAVLDRHPDVQHRDVAEAIEVTPAGGWDKGTAVEFILGLHEPNVFPVYFGDGANDVEAMAVAGLIGGVAVAVGLDAPLAATHRVASTEDLAARLEQLVRELARVRPTRAADRRKSDRGLAETDGAGQAQPIPGPADPAAHPSSGPGILLVDRDAAFRAEFSAAFRRLGWQVWEAAGPEDAIDVLRRHPDDIRAAVIDLQLSGLQGMRVLAEIGNCAPHVVRCGMSAEVSPYTAAAFRQLSDTPLFSKPFDFTSVGATLHRLIDAADGPAWSDGPRHGPI